MQYWPWCLATDAAVFEGLVVPVSYGWLVAAGLVGMNILDQQTLAAVSYYEASIDSLYNLSFRVGTVLKGSFSTEDVIASMNDVIVAETGADGGSIYLVDEFDDLIIAKAYAGVSRRHFRCRRAFHANRTASNPS